MEAKKFAAEGYTIVLVGHAGHEEVEGTMGEAPDHIVLIENEEDVDALEVRDPNKVAYISQTTLSVDETRAIINRLRERFPAIVGPRTDDICYATTNRQAAVKQLARECDLVLVIGSRNSSNSNRLVEVAREHGADSYLIDNEGQVRGRVARGQARIVGITSGASAPDELVQRLVEFFRVARDDRRAGARGRQGGRPLHAPQGDPPGDGGRRQADRLRTLVVSDLHLGAHTERDVLRRAPERERLLEALAGVDRLVLLGDVIELRHGPMRDALGAAAPVLAAIGDALGVGARGRDRAREPRPRPARAAWSDRVARRSAAPALGL